MMCTSSRYLLPALLLTMVCGNSIAADKNPGHFKMALVNVKSAYSAGSDVKTNEAAIQANLKRHSYFIDKLAGEGAEFMGFSRTLDQRLPLQQEHVLAQTRRSGSESPSREGNREGVYISAGLAEEDVDGKHWNTHIVIDPKGQIVGKQHKI